MNYTVIIPTCRSAVEVAPQVCELEGFCWPNPVVATCLPGSAAFNRNRGLDLAKTPLVVMVDDDVYGFYPGFAEKLLQVLADFNTPAVSARLLNPDGSAGPMMDIGTVIPGQVLQEGNLVPTAAVAFRNDGLRFDEAYQGSGWEDTDFCQQLKRKYPQPFRVHNGVRLYHRNEKKSQDGEVWNKNRAHYHQKWGLNG